MIIIIIIKKQEAYDNEVKYKTKLLKFYNQKLFGNLFHH